MKEILKSMERLKTQFMNDIPGLTISVLLNGILLMLILGCGSKQMVEVSPDGKTMTSSYSVDRRGELHGKSIEYYDSGRKREEAEYHHGLRHGLYIKYHENGRLFVKAEFDKERLMNVIECNDSSGNALPTGSLSNGNGPVMIYQSGGRIVESGEMLGGYRQGKWVTKASNGDTFIENYDRGIQIGEDEVSLIVW